MERGWMLEGMGRVVVVWQQLQSGLEFSFKVYTLRQTLAVFDVGIRRETRLTYPVTQVSIITALGVRHPTIFVCVQFHACQSTVLACFKG